MPGEYSLTSLAKPIAWLVVVLVATLLLRRRKVTTKVRVAFLVGGILVFGLLFGQIAAGRLDPNPVDFLRTTLRLITGTLSPALLTSRQPVVLFGTIMPLVVLLAVGWVSNKSICGWVCHLGLLQDLLHRIPIKKWKPSFRLSNTIRGIAFISLLGGLLVTGLDWIGWIDPFQIFRFNFNLTIGLFAVFLLVACLFIFRPWCQFLCPFGFVSWVVEQVSLLRPRINWQICKECKACVKACPTQAMADIYSGKKLHADCFACGACITACPQKEALRW